METSKTSTSKARRKRLILIGAAAIVVIALGVLIASGGEDNAGGSDIPTATVTRGDLVISITEKGQIEAKKKTTIANNLHWNVVIAERVEEGEHVKTGDLIIKFECKELLDALDQAKLSVVSAENNYEKAKEDVAIAEKDWNHKIVQAEARVENTENNLRKFQQHEQAQQLRSAISELTLAEQDLELAEGKLSFKEKVNAAPGLEETYSASTIKAERLSVDRLKLKVANAQAEVEKLKKYEHPRELRRLQLEVDDALLDLEKVTAEAKAQKRVAEVNLASQQNTYEMRKRKLEELNEDLKNLTQYAESPGIIIYSSGRHWEQPDVSVGAMVRSRQRLMQIPDMSSLCVTSRVFEGVCEKVRVGMPATIRLDSRPGEVYTGTLSKIAQVASSQDRWRSPNVKVFPIEIKMDDIPADLKPGSTAKIELVIAELTDVLTVPIAAVQTEQELTYCWRLLAGKAVRTAVEIGQLSETHVEIRNGLAEGDVVLLAPPADADLAAVEDDKSACAPAATKATPATKPAVKSNPATRPAAKSAEAKTKRPEGKRPGDRPKGRRGERGGKPRP